MSKSMVNNSSISGLNYGNHFRENYSNQVITEKVILLLSLLHLISSDLALSASEVKLRESDKISRRNRVRFQAKTF